ncbi:MAG: L,D-transpeptidase, partial [Chloroflexota bacterium]
PVWVEATGHTMSSALQDYWRVTGRSQFFGNPITEPFVAEDGTYTQIMENGAIQYVPELAFTLEPFVRFMPIGRQILQQRNPVGFRSDGRRNGGGGNAMARNWAFPEATLLEGWTGAYGEFGPAIDDRFVDWYWSHEGRFYLGYPLTTLLREYGYPAQWFEGGLLIDDNGTAKRYPMGLEIAERLGIGTTPVPQGDLPLDDENLFLQAAWNPYPTGNDPAGPGWKRIDVDVTRQLLTAYVGGMPILQSYISTGLWPNKTELGNFRVRNKRRLEDMRGATDKNGHVVWIVTDGGKPPEGSIPYGVADVPNVLYVNMAAEALHGAYWHNNFGNTMSHGCINCPLDVAAYLYEWAPLGTPVRVFVEDGYVYPGSEGASPDQLERAAKDAAAAGGT